MAAGKSTGIAKIAEIEGQTLSPQIYADSR
jgi:hypothetical protein